MSLKKYSVGDTLDFKFEIDGYKSQTEVVIVESYGNDVYKFVFNSDGYRNIVQICEKEDSNVQ